MKFNLTPEQYQLLKGIDFSEIGPDVEFLDNETAVSVANKSVGLFQIIISEEIDVNGLTDDQNDVLPYGRKLYAIYDSIYAQCLEAQQNK